MVYMEINNLLWIDSVRTLNYYPNQFRSFGVENDDKEICNQKRDVHT